MDISQRLLRLARAYVNDWLKRQFSSEDFEEPDWRSSDGDPDTAWDPEWDLPPRLDPKIERYYRRLEIQPGADFETVRKAWKTMMKKYHPDNFGRDPEKVAIATRICQDLTEAYLELQRHLKAK